MFARRNSEKIVLAVISGGNVLKLTSQKVFFQHELIGLVAVTSLLSEARLMIFLNFILDIFDQEVENSARKTHCANDAIHPVCVVQKQKSLLLLDT